LSSKKDRKGVEERAGTPGRSPGSWGGRVRNAGVTEVAEMRVLRLDSDAGAHAGGRRRRRRAPSPYRPSSTETRSGITAEGWWGFFYRLELKKKKKKKSDWQRVG